MSLVLSPGAFLSLPVTFPNYSSPKSVPSVYKGISNISTNHQSAAPSYFPWDPQKSFPALPVTQDPAPEEYGPFHSWRRRGGMKWYSWRIICNRRQRASCSFTRAWHWWNTHSIKFATWRFTCRGPSVVLPAELVIIHETNLISHEMNLISSFPIWRILYVA